MLGVKETQREGIILVGQMLTLVVVGTHEKSVSGGSCPLPALNPAEQFSNLRGAGGPSSESRVDVILNLVSPTPASHPNRLPH